MDVHKTREGRVQRESSRRGDDRSWKIERIKNRIITACGSRRMYETKSVSTKNTRPHEALRERPYSFFKATSLENAVEINSVRGQKNSLYSLSLES